MFIINATKALARIPVKSTKQLIELKPGEKSPELDDGLYNELITFIRAFGLAVEGYTANAGSVMRKHAGAVVASDPKANSGTHKAKERAERANAEALKRAEAVAAASARKAVPQAEEAAVAVPEAPAEQAAPEVPQAEEASDQEAPAEEATETAPVTPTATKSTAKKRTTTRRSPMRRKSTSKGSGTSAE